VLDAVRGKKVSHALDFLDFSNKKAAKFISKALNSALSNYAQKNENFDSDLLYVKEAYVDEGPKIKRFRPAAMGRATRILKRTSHLTVIVGEKG
tara:strand:- start:1020 stop:1301 length:282 start_codon:yes stop_codon:yes gene_type:complete